MSKMFGVGVPAINKKLKKTFNNGELDEKLVSPILTYRVTDGKLCRTAYYNLQMIIKIGTMLKSADGEFP
ncbi:MAG: hypothetical protein LBG46_07115 [Elusimicrobiota bacterium]|nr:hypothetical protein [Elusimicrobiota bacterium]